MGVRSGAAFNIRRAVDTDRAVMTAFIAHDLAGTPYAEVPNYFLGLALQGRSGESRAIVAEREGEVVGFALFGEVAGSVGTGRIHFVSVSASSRLNSVGVRLCEAVVSDVTEAGARLVIAEMPDDPTLVSGRALLARCGFTEVGRVPDYYREDVALVILARSTAGTANERA